MNRSFSLGKNKPTGKQQWVHPSEALLRGHIVYNVKFLGHVEVENPKGTEVVRDAIRKMKFNKQVKKAEGHKPPKVELTISVDGVTVQDPKTKIMQHQYPLHRISYCADDKSDKRMLTFIAKESTSNKHHCFVFDSDKCAEEITLTIGQAFNLAYKKFMETSSKDIDTKKQFLLLQKKVQQLTTDNLSLKERVADLERLIDPKVLENYELNKQNQETTKVSSSSSGEAPVVGRKLENLIFDEESHPPPAPPRPATNGANVTSPSQNNLPVLAPPPPVPSRTNVPRAQQKSFDSGDKDLFGQTPFSPTSPVSGAPPQAPNPTSSNPFMSPSPSQDPFGMGSFTPSGSELDRQIQTVDQELLDLQSGFSQGLSFGTEDFSLQDLDPLGGNFSIQPVASH